MTRVTGLDHLTLLDVAPPELVARARRGRVRRRRPARLAGHGGRAPWPMTPGSPMLAETAAPLRDSRGRGARRRGDPAPAGQARPTAQPVLETAAELGARYVNAICEDPDLERLSDEFGELAESAQPYGVRPVIEFMAYRTVRTLADAVAIAAAVRTAAGPDRRAARAAVRCRA